MYRSPYIRRNPYRRSPFRRNPYRRIRLNGGATTTDFTPRLADGRN